MMKNKGLIVAGFILAVICLFCGCEDGGESFDYSDNDPNVWVAFGDSITSGLDGESEPYPPRLARMTGKTVINEGYSGETAQEGAGRVWNVLNSYNPGRLMVLYGVNDIMRHADYEDIIGNLRTIVQAAKANNTRVAIATLLPMYDRHNGIFQGSIEEISWQIRQMAAEEGVQLVDLEPLFGTGEGLQIDGLHPNDAGNELIANAFR